MWAKRDEKLTDSVIRSLVMGTKWLLDKSVWAEPETGIVSIGSEQILQAEIVDNKLEIKYGTGWEEYLHDPLHPEFKELVITLQKKLSGAGAKGPGKFAGKFGGKFAGKSSKGDKNP